MTGFSQRFDAQLRDRTLPRLAPLPQEIVDLHSGARYLSGRTARMSEEFDRILQEESDASPFFTRQEAGMAAYGYLSDLAAQFNVLARHLDEELPRLVETVALMAQTGGMDALSVFTYNELSRALTDVQELRFHVSQRDQRLSTLERENANLETTRANLAQALALHEQ